MLAVLLVLGILISQILGVLLYLGYCCMFFFFSTIGLSVHLTLDHVLIFIIIIINNNFKKERTKQDF